MEIDESDSETRAALGDQATALPTAVAENIPLAMFAFFDIFPAATLIQGLAIVPYLPLLLNTPG